MPEMIDLLEALHDDLAEKISDVLSSHKHKLIEFEADFLKNIPEPWVYLKFDENMALRAHVNFSTASGEIGTSYTVEIQGLEDDLDEKNLGDAISGIGPGLRRKQAAEYFRWLADAIEASNA